MKDSVGIIGGVGPMATVYFMDLIISMTEAEKDQDHINMLVSNHATIPDRTEYIMGRSSESPEASMVEDAMMLERSGCGFLVIPCNTAHNFYGKINDAAGIPVLNIIQETIDFSRAKGAAGGRQIGTLGIMATEGTVVSDIYGRYCEPEGISTCYPDPEYQKKVNHIIYDCIKAGLPVSEEEMMEVIDHLRDKGADAIVMGCTELSVAYKDLDLGSKNEDLVDSLDALARATITKSGRKIRQEKK